MINIIDWILNLFRHEDAARAFVAAPEQTLRDAGLGAISPAQLSSVAATAVPGMMLGNGDPVVGLQRAVSNHYGFAPSNEWAPSNQWASNNDWAPNLLSPTYAPSPTFAPQTDLASHNQTDLLSHNATSMLSPEQSSGANAQQGAFNLGFGDVTLFGSKTTASDGSVVVNGSAHGNIVSGDGAVLGNGNDVNNGHISAGTGSNVADSSRTRVVSALTSVVAPPMTPAMAMAPDSSAMTTSSASRVRSTPSRVSSFSPASALRTATVPLTRSASKACSGWPSSIMT